MAHQQHHADQIEDPHEYTRHVKELKIEKKTNKNVNASCLITSNSLMETQESGGKPCIMGTRNCRHPDQCPTNSIMQIRLNIRMKTPIEFKS